MQTNNRLKSLTIKQKSRDFMIDSLRKAAEEPRPNDVPGFIVSRDPAKGWVYSVDKQYINGHRKSQLMPVNPQYDIVRGVELLGHPRVSVYEEMARSPRSEEAGTRGLPTVDQLKDEKFYTESILPIRGSLGYDWLKKEFGNEKDRISGHISSLVEILPYADNVFIFLSISVSYTHGIQFLGDSNDRLIVKGARPLAFVNGRFVLSAEAEEANGLAYVGHVRVPVDFRDYFKSPINMREFKGELPTTKEVPVERTRETGVAYDMFRELFKEKLEQIGQQVEEFRKMHVKGVLLSPIKLNSRMSDSGLSIGYSPEGELVIAASYLV